MRQDHFSIAKKRERQSLRSGSLANVRFPLKRGTNDGMKIEPNLFFSPEGREGILVSKMVTARSASATTPKRDFSR
jgi:hypothetical protein